MQHVLKIGGSNLKDPDDLLHIHRIVQQYNDSAVLVLSAVYGVTDALIALMQAVLRDEAPIERQLQPILDSYCRILLPHVPPEDHQALRLRFEERAEHLKRFLLGIQCFRQIPDFAYHYVCSYGERFATLMLHLFFDYQGKKNRELLPEDCGLLTSGKFPSKEIDFEHSSVELKKHIQDDHCLYLMPGFYAISRDGKVSLLGRGGTDYSAAAIAYCIGAKSLDIWKDVDGFLSADPKLVPAAHLIPTLSYSEAAELAYFGAKILHPRTMHPVKLGSIPVRILNIRKEGANPGSIIQAGAQISSSGVKSVSHSLNFGILRIAGPDVGMEAGIISDVSSLFATHELNIKSILTSQTAINFLFEKEDLTKARELLERLDSEALEEISAIDDIAILALVGEGFRDSPGLMAKALVALSRININVEMMVAGASPVSSYLIVKQNQLKEALQAIHREFFPSPA
ncbi:MAG: aspartate kinase [Spirochaetes bacterium]|nr:aspartate kinase [Spirochaetota bacterium]MBU0955318.1 aspartate kinase [Spirochaetota bacterium]